MDGFIDELRLIDDYFMTVVFDRNYPATELLLGIILGRNNIKLRNIQVQKLEKNPKRKGRSVILDILTDDVDMNIYNIEMQKNKKGAGVRRSRFHSSVLDFGMLKEGQDFSEIKNSYVIFITEKDILKNGLPIYNVKRTIMESEQCFEDGNSIIYVNCEYEDETSPIGKLIHDLKCKNPGEMYYKELRESVSYYKENQEGRKIMSDLFDEYLEKSRQEGIKIGLQSGKAIGIKSGKRKGEMKKARNVARNLYAMGTDIESISKIVEIPVEKIREWVEKDAVM